MTPYGSPVPIPGTVIVQWYARAPAHTYCPLRPPTSTPAANANLQGELTPPSASTWGGGSLPAWICARSSAWTLASVRDVAVLGGTMVPAGRTVPRLTCWFDPGWLSALPV